MVPFLSGVVYVLVMVQTRTCKPLSCLFLRVFFIPTLYHNYNKRRRYVTDTKAELHDKSYPQLKIHGHVLASIIDDNNSMLDSIQISEALLPLQCLFECQALEPSCFFDPLAPSLSPSRTLRIGGVAWISELGEERAVELGVSVDENLANDWT